MVNYLYLNCEKLIMRVYISGEDGVTKAIAKRLVLYTANTSDIDFFDATSRDSGSKVWQNLDRLVKLGEKNPTVAVYDSDGECVISLLQEYCPNGWDSRYSAINIAISEAESWLLADREGFSNYLHVAKKHMPVLQEHKMEISDSIDYKISLYLMRNIAPESNKASIREGLRFTDRYKKPSTYNEIIVPFVDKYWNIDNALHNSESLRRSVRRVRAIFSK